jgi:hypothetical protein
MTRLTKSLSGRRSRLLRTMTTITAGSTPAQLDVMSQGCLAVKDLAASHALEAAHGDIRVPIALGPDESVGVLVAAGVLAAP